MAEKIDIENLPSIYFLLKKEDINCEKTYRKDIVYVGTTKTEHGKRVYSHIPRNKKPHEADYKDFNVAKAISSRKLGFLKNKYFREYYEERIIEKFRPKKDESKRIYYNGKQRNIIPTLNNFLLKMFLFFENPNTLWINPLTEHCPFKRQKNSYGDYWLKQTYQNKTKWTINGYTRVWENLDLTKKLYINNQNAFKFLSYEKMKPALKIGKLRKVFTPRKETISN